MFFADLVSIVRTKIPNLRGVSTKKSVSKYQTGHVFKVRIHTACQTFDSVNRFVVSVVYTLYSIILFIYLKISSATCMHCMQVRDETSGSPPPSFEATAHSFSVLQPCSVEDLERVIMSSPAKSCELDPIPTFLLREFLKDLLPFIHLMCNSSISAGLLPSSQKKAVVTPAIKKRGLDSEVMNNYRPISNLSFLSKIMEKVVSKQLLDYLNGHELLPKFQSGFRSGHSTETVLIRL